MVNIDPKRVDRDGREIWEVHINGGRVPTGLEAVAWAREVERLGAGEIVLTSMDADGTKNGYDLPMTRAVAEAVEVPVVASGGAGSPEHLRAALIEGGRQRGAGREHLPLPPVSRSPRPRSTWPSHGVPVRLVAATGRRPSRDPRNRSDTSSASVSNRTTDPIHPRPRRADLSQESQPMATVVEADVEASANEPEANKLFRMVMKHKGSDLHLKVGLPPAMRLAGVLRQMQLPAAHARPTWSG